MLILRYWGTAVGLHHGVVERTSGPGHPPVDDRNGDEVRLRSIGVAVRRIDQEFGCAINFLSFRWPQCRKNLLTGHARVDLTRVDLARLDLGQVVSRNRCGIRAPIQQDPPKRACHDQARAEKALLRAPMMHRAWLTLRSPQDRALS